MIRRSLLALAVLSLPALAACQREESMEEKLRKIAAAQRFVDDSLDRAGMGVPDTMLSMPAAEEVRAYRLDLEKVRRWGQALNGVRKLSGENRLLVARILARADTLAPTPDQRSQAFRVAQAAEPLMAAEIRRAGLEPRDWIMISIKVTAAASARTRDRGGQGGADAELATPEDVRFVEENQDEVIRAMSQAVHSARSF